MIFMPFMAVQKLNYDYAQNGMQLAQHRHFSGVLMPHRPMREQAPPIRAGRSQDDSLLALPKNFYIGFASTLGITKDITRTQAYSVWLQGMKNLSSLLVQALKNAACKSACIEGQCEKQLL